MRRNNKNRGRYNKTSKRPPASMLLPIPAPSKNDAKSAISNHLYMAPQATIRTIRNQIHNNNNNNPQAYGSGSGGVVLEDGSAGIKTSSTRRRRRGSSEIDMDHLQPEKTGRVNVGGATRTPLAEMSPTPFRTSLADKLPTPVQRQDSDGSLGAMASVLAADRRDAAAAATAAGHNHNLPPAPMLWTENNNESALDNHHHVSPKMTMRKKPAAVSSSAEKIPTLELNRYNRRSNHSAASSKGKMKKVSVAGSSQNIHSRSVHYGHEDYSETLEDSFTNISEHSPLPPSNHGPSPPAKPWCRWKSILWSIRVCIKGRAPTVATTTVRWGHILQISVLVILAIIVFDSHSKVQTHKNQLRQYDEERSHILDQMLWLDTAAKRVHKKYADQEILNSFVRNNENVEGANRMEEQQALLEETQQNLQKIQHTIQLNAREHLASTFRERPVEVSLQLTKDGDKLLIGLSDDSPHAISTLVQQVNRHFWDNIQATPMESVLELRTATSDTESNFSPENGNIVATPFLEFVERSHGCREVGSVSMRQEYHKLDDPTIHNREPERGSGSVTDATHLVLSVHLKPVDQSLPEGDVCIGRVLRGLDDVVKLHRLDVKV